MKKYDHDEEIVKSEVIQEKITIELPDMDTAINDPRVADIQVYGMVMILKTGQKLFLRNVNSYENGTDTNMIFTSL